MPVSLVTSEIERVMGRSFIVGPFCRAGTKKPAGREPSGRGEAIGQGNSDCARPDDIRSGDEAQSPDGLELAVAHRLIQTASRQFRFHECQIPFKAERPRMRVNPQGNDICDGDWVKITTDLGTMNLSTSDSDACAQVPPRAFGELSPPLCRGRLPEFHHIRPLAQLFKIIRPPLRHFYPLLPVGTVIICAADFIPVLMRKCPLNSI